MPVWGVILIIGCAGAVGGIINALIANEGLLLPRSEPLVGGQKLWRPGFMGNVFIGAVTAIVLAGLYSPAGSIRLDNPTSDPGFILTLGMLAGALLSGIGGARLLTNELDKRFEQTTRDSLGKTIQNLAKPSVEPPSDKLP